MRRGVLLFLLLSACGATPAAGCRTNADCASDRVCIAGACGPLPTRDAASSDSGSSDSGSSDAAREDSGTTPSDAAIAPPPGESCANPILLSPVAEGSANPTAEWNGELGDYADDEFPDCSGPDVDAPDILFEIQRPEVVSDLVITTSPAGLDTIMALDDGCDGRFSWACNDDRDPDVGGGGDVSSAIFVWHFDPALAEHLYLIVDGGRSTVRTGAIGVHVEVRAPSVGDCTSALDLSGGGALLAFAPLATPPNQGDCMAAPAAGDVLFRIGDGSARAGRFGVESSDHPVSLRLVGTGCTTSGMCAPTMGDVSFHYTDLGPIEEAGFGFIAVEGIVGPSDGTPGTFSLDYNP